MIRELQIDEITSVDDLHKSLKGEGREVDKSLAYPDEAAPHPKASEGDEKVEVSHVMEQEFETPGEGHDDSYTTPPMLERPMVGPTEPLVDAGEDEWKGDEQIGKMERGEEDERGDTAEMVPEGGAEARAGDYRVRHTMYEYSGAHLLRSENTDENTDFDGFFEKADAKAKGPARPGARGGNIIGYDKQGNPIYAKPGSAREQEEKKREAKRTTREVERTAAKKRKESKKEKTPERTGVLEGRRGGRVAGHGPGGQPIYEREQKEKAMSDTDLQKAALLPTERAAAAKREVKETGTSAEAKTPRQKMTTGALKQQIAGQGFEMKMIGGKMKIAPKTQKAFRVLNEELGGIDALFKSIGVLAANAGTIRVAEDMAWDNGMDEESYQSLRTLMRSFPPRMWQFLKRTADKTIDPRTALMHIADCIGEVNKAMPYEDDLMKGGDFDAAGYEAEIDQEMIPKIEKAMEECWNKSWSEAEEAQKGNCPTHAYSTSGYAYGSNPDGFCNCTENPISKGLVSERAMEMLLEKAADDDGLVDAIGLLGIDRGFIREYAINE